MQKIFYDKARSREIFDVTGKQTLAQIKKKHGKANYQTIEIDEKLERHAIVDGKLEKRSLLDDQRKAEQDNEKRKQLLEQKATGLKAKLGLSDKEFEDLQAVMKEL